MNGFLNQFPYSDFHEMNLDWIIKTVKNLHNEMIDFEAVNKITFGGTWNITKSYAPWTIVEDGDYAYVSLSYVPAGIQLNNKKYWQPAGALTINIEDVMDLNVFPVGPDCRYTTIKDAYDAVVDNHGGTILIYPGFYDEAITMTAGSDSYDIKFIGVSRDKCIWRSSQFGYANACFTGSGNLTFENLTMQKGDPIYIAEAQGGYALHMDYPNTEGNMYVRNCTLFSNENAAVGCGTRTDQKLFFENCTFISTIPFSISTNGAFLYHTAPEGNHTGQGFSMINCICLGLGVGSSALNIYNSAANTESFDITLINNRVMSELFQQADTLSNYWDGVVSTSLSHANSTISLKDLKCFGNNHNKLNALPDETVNQQTKLATGRPFPVTDTLNPPVLNGYITIPSNSADTPQSGHDFYGMIMSLNTGYHIYIVTDSNTAGPIYTKIIKNGAVGSDWSYSGASVKQAGRTSHPLKYYKIGKLVSVTFTGMPANSTAYNIVAGYRPEYAIYGACYIIKSSTMILCSVIVNTDGSYTITRSDGEALTSNDLVYGNMTWFIP